MNRPLTVIAWIFFVVFAVSVVRYMDGFYDKADLKNAQNVIVGARPQGAAGALLTELMAADLGARPEEVACTYQLFSASEGTVLVRCGKYSKDQVASGDEKIYEWMVHRLNGRVTAQNQDALELEKRWQSTKNQ